MIVATVAHLLKRWAGSLNRRPIPEDQRAVVSTLLTPGEYGLWQAMRIEDRRHSLIVYRRYRSLRPLGARAEYAAALLHDVGKVAADIGTFARVLATLVGPRGARFRAYHDHEALGSAMAEDIHADPLTVAMIRGDGPAELMDALSRADMY